MNIDLNKLGCSHNDLLEFVHVLKRVKPTHIYALARRGELYLSACNTTVRGNTNSRDTVTVTIPYKGKKAEAFVETREMTRGLCSKERVLVFESSPRPADWTEKLSTRVTELIELNARNVHLALEYLLRVKHSKAKYQYAGLIFTQGEVINTDGVRMHIDSTLPPIVNYGEENTDDPTRFLMGLGAATALHRLTNLMVSGTMRGGYQKCDPHFRGFQFELKHGKITASVTSVPHQRPVDTRSARPRGDENNALFTVHTDHLETTLKHSLKYTKKGERSYVRIEHSERDGVTALKLDFYTFPTKSEVGTHYIVCAPTQGFVQGRWFMLDTEFLLEAIQGIGPATQFILPSDPRDGLKHCYVNPVYVTGKPGRFAVIMPRCDSDIVNKIRESRRVHDSRTDHQDSRQSV